MGVAHFRFGFFFLLVVTGLILKSQLTNPKRRHRFALPAHAKCPTSFLVCSDSLSLWERIGERALRSSPATPLFPGPSPRGRREIPITLACFPGQRFWLVTHSRRA